MRILVNASRELANPSAGGSEVYVDVVLDGLAARGHDVLLSAGGPVGRRRYATRDAGSTLGQFLRYPMWSRRRADDVVIDVANGLTFYSPLWRRTPTVCLVHHVHTEMWSQWFSPPVAALGRFLERRAMPIAYRRSTFLTVSDSTRDALVSIGVDPGRIEVVHNAVEVPAAPAALRSATPLFVAVGRLVPHKRFDVLLEHWPTVRALTGGRLVIVGDGPERDRLERLATDGVELVGRLDDRRRDELMASAWLLVHPASLEGWGLVIMEAAAQSTAALGFDAPGVRDAIVDGVTGALARDRHDLVRQWVSLSRDPSVVDRMGDAARERAVRFSADALVDGVERVVRAAAVPAGVRRPTPRPVPAT